MKRLTHACFFLLLISQVVFAQTKEKDFANFDRYAQENDSLIQNHIQPQTVFMGNSITELWNDLDPYFFKQNNFLSRGISGQVSSQMLLRFREDVIKLHPQRVVILAGTNDIAQNQGPISLDKILGNIVSMTELANNNNIHVVLSSVLPAQQFPWRKKISSPADKIIKLNKMIIEYAKKNHIPYINYWTTLKNAQNGLRKELTKDGVHPNKKGYSLMEKIAMKTLQ